MSLVWQVPAQASMSASSGADWITQAGLESRLDPYLFWAEQTGFAGYVLGDDGKLQVAIELAAEASANEEQRRAWCSLLAAEARTPAEHKRAEVAPAYATRLAGKEVLRFFTARLEITNLAHRFAPYLHRLKAGLVGGGDRSMSAMSAATVELPWDRVKGLLCDGDIGAVRRMMAGNLNAGGLATNWPLLNEAAQPEPAMTGQTVLGVVDFGCPFAHEHFSAPDGGTRIRHLWDQGRSPGWPASTGLWREPSDFAYGRETAATRLQACLNLGAEQAAGRPNDRRLREQLCYAIAGLPELLASWSHGAMVMDVAAGRGFVPPGILDPLMQDAAGAAEIVFVQLPEPAITDLSGGWLAVYVIDAIEYILARAQGADHIVINLSLGTYAGSHDGQSLLECALDHYASLPGVVIVLAAGNVDVERPVHAQALSIAPGDTSTLYWQVPPEDPTQNFLELWYQWADGSAGGVEIEVEPPGSAAPISISGRGARTLERRSAALGLTAAQRTLIGGAVLADDSRAGGRNGLLLVSTGPTRTDPPMPDWPLPAPAGRWTIRVTNHAGKVPAHLQVDAWVERNEPGRSASGDVMQSYLQASDAQSGFKALAQAGTLTGQSCGSRTIVVGNYVAGSGLLAVDSARGPARQIDAAPRVGPDLVAPGARVLHGQLRGIAAAANLTGNTVEQSGTSLAAPWVARGIVNWLLQTPGRHATDKATLLAGILGDAAADHPDPGYGLGGLGPDGLGHAKADLPDVGD